MGKGITVRCGRCGYEKEFLLGLGMSHGSLEEILKELPAGCAQAALHILQEHSVESHSSGIKLLVCTGCGRLSSEMCLDIHYDGGKLFSTEHTCPKCRGRLERAGRTALVRRPCPRCRERALRTEETALWD
jgi:hypothetical protein